MFDMNQRYIRPIILFIALIVAPIAAIQIKHVHSSVSYQWAIYQNAIDVVMHRLVGVGLKIVKTKLKGEVKIRFL